MGKPRAPFPTPVERRVLDLMVYGKTNEDIAQLLGRSVATVRGTVSKIMVKMNAENRTQVVSKYLRPDLFEKKGNP